MKEKLTLRPGDYLVVAPGLKIENTTTDYIITFETPDRIDIKIIEKISF